METERTLSVLIPTLGRNTELIDTVRALLSQTVKPLEILVCDQNHPSLLDVDAELAALPNVRHLRSRVLGISNNYNLLLSEARGEVVLYLDDDVVPETDLIEKHLATYDDPTVVGVAGRVFQPTGDQELRTIRAVGRFDRVTGTVVANFNHDRSSDVDFAQGCNMSFRRNALLAVGGFDCGFDGNGYFFETDAGLRLQTLGKILFQPKAALKHLAASAGGARIHEKSLHTYHFVRNGLRLHLRHGNRLLWPWFLMRAFVYGLVKSVKNGDRRIFTRSLQAILEAIDRILESGIRFDGKLVTSRDLERERERVIVGAGVEKGIRAHSELGT